MGWIFLILYFIGLCITGISVAWWIAAVVEPVRRKQMDSESYLFYTLGVLLWMFTMWAYLLRLGVHLFEQREKDKGLRREREVGHGQP